MDCTDTKNLVSNILTKVRAASSSQYRRDFISNEDNKDARDIENTLLEYRRERLVTLRAFHGTPRVINIMEWRGETLRMLAPFARSAEAVQYPPIPLWLTWKF